MESTAPANILANKQITATPGSALIGAGAT